MRNKPSIKKVMLKPEIGFESCVGIWDTKFPILFGNYCSINDGSFYGIRLCNMWSENLREWAKRNPDITEIEITVVEHVGKSIGFVSDVRLKDWCNSKPCVTGHGWGTVAIMKTVQSILNFDTTNMICGCEKDEEGPSMSWMGTLQDGGTYLCRRCKRKWKDKV